MVEFESGRGAHGPQALNVTPASKDSARPQLSPHGQWWSQCKRPVILPLKVVRTREKAFGELRRKVLVLRCSRTIVAPGQRHAMYYVA